MRICALLDEKTNFYFAEIEGEELPGIIIQTADGEIDLFCYVEHAEELVKQLQRYINKYKLKVVE
ncbi:hypothetical protein BhaS171_00021 [Bacillus phage vB_BhaS-171]|uniref:hypothetical protein n=1 Tax=Bacillus phage vB_BhaS-171 TaxID=1775140 RepID=UPI000744C14C|nr:hypothetical protein BH781_gp21 [Bacillus phage vB_BhaS-171]ALY08077.1 hypothetical protein BhaS171_00021 [Bacillus phage vB_BhaS-171]